MVIEVDFDSQEPICRRKTHQIKNLFLAEHLSPGSRLPPVRQETEELNVNFNTVARAYRALDREGWLSTWQGRGTYVLGKPMSELSRRAREWEMERL